MRSRSIGPRVTSVTSTATAFEAGEPSEDRLEPSSEQPTRSGEAEEAQLLRKLEPWPLQRCLPFNQALLAGYFGQNDHFLSKPFCGEARIQDRSGMTT